MIKGGLVLEEKLNYVTFDWHHVVGGNTLPMARTKPSLYKEEEVDTERFGFASP
jgi:hypothetical protein